jgi:CHASE2 domain-containing sensor protein
MTEPHDSVWAAIWKVIAVAMAWFGSVQLADVQAMVAILSGLCVAGYAVLQAFVLWRDKIKRDNQTFPKGPAP